MQLTFWKKSDKAKKIKMITLRICLPFLLLSTYGFPTLSPFSFFITLRLSQYTILSLCLFALLPVSLQLSSFLSLPPSCHLILSPSLLLLSLIPDLCLNLPYPPTAFFFQHTISHDPPTHPPIPPSPGHQLWAPSGRLIFMVALQHTSPTWPGVFTSALSSPHTGFCLFFAICCSYLLM